MFVIRPISHYNVFLSYTNIIHSSRSLPGPPIFCSVFLQIISTVESIYHHENQKREDQEVLVVPFYISHGKQQFAYMQGTRYVGPTTDSQDGASGLR